ncbi:DUF4111 domain-containing protein [Candidatus Roizmanbacteria bacterium]|nr:DUF4111 domain-containing protein [Candidatus Roizmanbacteria bacterium]
MHPTPYADINSLLDELLQRIRKILGDKLVGFYLYGSFVWGDFEYDTSDIDMLAAIKSDITEKEFEALKQMHADFVKNYPAWDDRIEVQYYSLNGLQTFKTKSSLLTVISPGDSLHTVDAGIEWLVNWYFVQEYGVTLWGPKPSTIIPHISKGEFLQAVKNHALNWKGYVKRTIKSRSDQAYAILTLCRALYTSNTSKQVSKKKAAAWAMQELPEWSTLIQNALAWRKDRLNKQIDHEATYPKTVKFVNDVIDQIRMI